MATLTLTVATGTDDAVLDDLGYSDTGATATIGGTGTTNVNHGQGWRFTSVSFIGTETINSAILKLMKNGAQFSQQDNHWTCMAQDNIPTFSSGASPGSYAPVATIVNDQNNVNEADLTVFNFPRAAADQITFGGAIKNVISRAGWANNNALAVGNNLDQDTSEYTTFARKSFFEQDSAQAGSDPQLVIDYTAGTTVARSRTQWAY